MLTVNTLGRFQMMQGNEILNDDNIRSTMITKLLMYVLVYRDKALTVDEISSAIWQEDETDNPTGALKNLMYRLRGVLKKQFGDTEFILTNRGSYQWNPDVKVNIDVEHFERLIAKGRKENNASEAIQDYEEALGIYQGDFMAKISDMHWILTLNTYYHSLYLSCVKSLAELYIIESRYDELEKICNDALKFDSADEQLYCYLIQARMRRGKIALAMDSYEKAKLIMSEELGVRQTMMLNKVYEELLTMNKGQQADRIEDIYEDISEEDPKGVFMCGYPIFREIYRLEARKNSRSDVEAHVILFTLEDAKEERRVAEFRVKQGMHAFETVITSSLRIGDVAAKYSETQYILLLPNCDYECALLVANRLISKLYDENPKHKHIKVKVNVETVESEEGLMKVSSKS